MTATAHEGDTASRKNGARSALVLLRIGAAPEIAHGLLGLLHRNGFEVVVTRDESHAFALLLERSFTVALLDVGLAGLERLMARAPARGLVLLAPFSEFESSMSAVRNELARAVGRAALLVPGAPADKVEPPLVEDLRQARLAFERAHVRRVLERHAGDKARAAEALGLDVSSLYRKLHQDHENARGS